MECEGEGVECEDEGWGVKMRGGVWLATAECYYRELR